MEQLVFLCSPLPWSPAVHSTVTKNSQLWNQTYQPWLSVFFDALLGGQRVAQWQQNVWSLEFGSLSFIVFKTLT